VEITVEKTVNGVYVVKFFMKEGDELFETGLLSQHIAYFNKDKITKVEGGYEYITEIQDIRGFGSITPYQYAAITGDTNAPKFFGTRSRLSYEIDDIMHAVAVTPEHLTRIAQFIRSKFEFFKSLTVNIEYPARVLTETFTPDVSILNDGVVFNHDGAYRIHFTKISDAKFEDVEKKYKSLLEKKYESEYRRHLNIFKDYMNNMQETLKNVQNSIMKNISNILSAARSEGFNIMQSTDGKTYLEYDYSKYYTAPVKPSRVLLNRNTYTLTKTDLESIEKLYGRDIKMTKIYVDLLTLLTHNPGGEKVYVYADRDMVHVNVTRDVSVSNGKYAVCTGDLGNLDSVGFIKGIVRLLFTMNCDSPYNGLLQQAIAKIILAEGHEKPVQAEAELFSTRSE